MSCGPKLSNLSRQRSVWCVAMWENCRRRNVLPKRLWTCKRPCIVDIVVAPPFMLLFSQVSEQMCVCGIDCSNSGIDVACFELHEAYLYDRLHFALRCQKVLRSIWPQQIVPCARWIWIRSLVFSIPRLVRKGYRVGGWMRRRVTM